MNCEIKRTEKLYEDDEIVLLKETDIYGRSYHSLGYKNKQGDVCENHFIRRKTPSDI